DTDLVQHDRLIARHLLKFSAEAGEQTKLCILNLKNFRRRFAKLGSFKHRSQRLTFWNRYAIKFRQKFGEVIVAWLQKRFRFSSPLLDDEPVLPNGELLSAGVLSSSHFSR